MGHFFSPVAFLQNGPPYTGGGEVMDGFSGDSENLLL
jgi:hypothetical protein